MMKTFTIACTDYEVAADWYEGTSSEKILLVLIGWSSNKARYPELINSIVEQTGMSALVFDYSGHGESPFELADTRPAQHFLEVIYVFDWLRQHYPNAEISVMGSSYGGFLATQLTKYRMFKNLVLRVPAIYKPEAFYDPWSVRLNNIPAYTAELDKYRTDSEQLSQHPLLARASKFQGKTTVIVHGQDELVPKQTTDAFVKAFGADTYVAEGFSHGYTKRDLKPDQIAAYQSYIANWLNKN